MGDSSPLGPDHVVALVHGSEQDVAEVNGPDPVVDLLETLRPDKLLPSSDAVRTAS